MNDPQYRPRALACVVERALRDHPVVVVTGARQTGKTTLVRNLPSAATRTFQSLDELEALDLARRRPEDLLARGARLTIDEVQRVPDLLLTIKRDVDRRRRPGRFLLTGSANLLLMSRVADSLAGRAVYLHLWPFTCGERERRGTVPPWTEVLDSRTPADLAARLERPEAARADWRRQILTGGMPRAVLARTARERARWFDGYIRTYLERDLMDLARVSSLPDFRRLMGLAVHRLGGILNQTELGRDAGLPQATAHRYLNLLETTFQLERLPAFAASASKRLIKAPKPFWIDTGLAAHLAGVHTLNDLRGSAIRGALTENLVLGGLRAWRETCDARPSITYWRTAGGAEVDFVVEHRKKLLPVEVKAAKRVRVRDLRHLELFLSDHDARLGVVIHDTPGPQVLTRGIVALPLALFA